MDYSWYELPSGWKKLFKQFWNDIKDKVDEEFKFLQVKEKFGQMRIYTHGESKEIQEIISKYEYISQFICVDCGKPANYETTGYIAPLCEECIGSIQTKGARTICFDPIMQIKRWTIDGTECLEYDVSDIWERYCMEFT